MSGYEVAQLEEIEEVDYRGTPWRPVRHHLGITAFGINAWVARSTGDRVIGDHDESEATHQRLYLVLKGRAIFELDGERVDAPTGTLVFVPPGTERTVVAEEPGTTVVVVGAAAGHAYEPDGWEIWAPLQPLYEAGEYAAVADRAREVVEARPRYAEPLYNLACCESLAGRTTDAVEHLRQAIEQSERLRSLAADDSDFDPIRDEPAFKKLIA
jgi:mannose-6-phosphate isomerase-like protein (cupin superfamily)